MFTESSQDKIIIINNFNLLSVSFFFDQNLTLPTLKNWNKTDKNIFKPTNCTSLVSLPSVLNNTWNINITKYLRGLSYLNKFTLGILIGILLVIRRC